MKKKGLIISTVVMAVVLIASLTTATYAWFSASATAVVDTIKLQATAADGLLIGAKASTSDATYTGYVNGSVVWDKGTALWTNGNIGFGTNVNMQTPQPTADDEDNVANMVIGAGNAVSYSVSGIENIGAIETGTLAAATWYKANGDGANLDKKTVESAEVQYDYADLTFGVTAAKADSVRQAYLTIAITPTESKIGMAAAIHLIVYVDNVRVVGSTADLETSSATYEGLSAYTGMKHSNNYVASDISAGTYNASPFTSVDGKHNFDARTWTYVVPIFDSATAMVPTTEIHTVRIIAWIEGTDDACVLTNAGTGGNISLLFDYATDQDFEFGKNSSGSWSGAMIEKA